MKRYISAVVSIEKLREQFAPELEDDKFQELIELDPSADFEKNRGGKYCPWIFRQYNKGNLDQSEYTNLKDALGFFLNNYKKYPKPDLGQYKTVEEFLTDTEAVGNRELTEKEKAKLLKKQAHHANTDDKEFCVEDGDWEVWKPLTYPGSISLAREGGTKATWCTAYEGDDYYWRSYSRRGPLYIFLNTKNPNEKFQLHFESNSWYDINDRSKGLAQFYKFCSEHPNFQAYFGIKEKDGVQYRADSIVGYVEDAKEIKLPEDVRFPWDFPDSVESIIFPDSLTTLEQEGLRDLSNLKKVKLPEGIKVIPDRFFMRCGLESIDIPNSVVKYESSAFQNCENLITINHSTSLKVVEDSCFRGCSQLTSQLPDSVVYLGTYAFKDCGLTYVEMPSKLQRIVTKTFLNDTSIEEVKFNNVTEVGPSAFNGSSLEKLDLGSVAIVGGGAFRNCNSLKGVDLDLGGMKIGAYAFADSEIEGTITVDDGTDLSFSAFDNCPNLTIIWNRADESYEFENIKLLKCSEATCPNLIKVNKDYINIETTEGHTYEVQ